MKALRTTTVRSIVVSIGKIIEQYCSPPRPSIPPQRILAEYYPRLQANEITAGHGSGNGDERYLHGNSMNFEISLVSFSIRVHVAATKDSFLLVRHL